MLYVTEEEARSRLSIDLAYSATEDVFRALGQDQAMSFPTVREAIGYEDALFGFKSGFNRTSLTLGVKAGGYWKNNHAKGLTNHQSVVVLFNADTGQPKAVVSGNYLTSMRTAAAAAVSIKWLSRADSQTLSILGAGHQSEFHIRAAVAQRDIQRVIIANRTREKAQALRDRLQDLPCEISIEKTQTAAKEADVLISLVSSFEVQIKSDWVKPGTHIAAMGTDTVGKQELEPALSGRADCFTDDLDQSVVLGELQHAVASGLIRKSDITPLADVVIGKHPGRASDDAITLYDGTGIGLQDLAVAHAVLPADSLDANAS